MDGPGRAAYFVDPGHLPVTLPLECVVAPHGATEVLLGVAPTRFGEDGAFDDEASSAAQYPSTASTPPAAAINALKAALSSALPLSWVRAIHDLQRPVSEGDGAAVPPFEGDPPVRPESVGCEFG